MNPVAKLAGFVAVLMLAFGSAAFRGRRSRSLTASRENVAAYESETHSAPLNEAGA